MDLFAEIRDRLGEGRRGALATIVTTRGSTPGKEAMKLLVLEDGKTSGSVGGGCVEADVWEAAREVLAGGSSRLLRFRLTEEEMGDTGLICGGLVDIFVQPLPSGPLWARAADLRARGEAGALVTRLTGDGEEGRLALVGRGGAVLGGDAPLGEAARGLVDEALAADRAVRGAISLDDRPHEAYAEPLAVPTLWIFGGGHVSLALAETAVRVGFRVGVVDDRRAFANPERFPMAFATIASPFPGVLDEVPVGPSDSLVIVTRGHREDETVLRWAVRRPARSVGMIGSRRKIRAAFDRLRQEGVPEEALRRVMAPVGLDLGAETSAEIALAIAAELVAIRRLGPDGPFGRPLRDVKGPFGRPLRDVKGPFGAS